MKTLFVTLMILTFNQVAQAQESEFSERTVISTAHTYEFDENSDILELNAMKMCEGPATPLSPVKTLLQPWTGEDAPTTYLLMQHFKCL